MANVPTSKLKAALSEVDFPADKDTILRSAEEQGASADALEALRSLPPVDYTNVDEVIRSTTEEVGTGPVESVHADPDNKPRKPGVAERLR